MSNITGLLVAIMNWGLQTNIIGGSTAKSQILKLCTEYGELINDIIRGQDVKDSIGDCFVCLVMACRIKNLDPAEVIGKSIENTKVISRVDDDTDLLALGWLEIGYALRASDSASLCKTEIETTANILTRIAVHHNVCVEECLEVAHEEIKDREGVLYRGVFIRSTDEAYEGARLAVFGEEAVDEVPVEDQGKIEPENIDVPVEPEDDPDADLQAPPKGLESGENPPVDGSVTTADGTDISPPDSAEPVTATPFVGHFGVGQGDAADVMSKD
jgi:hypothetical protein